MTTYHHSTEKEILEGLEYINQILTRHSFPPTTLEQYKEALNHPISDKLLPRYPVRNNEN